MREFTPNESKIMRIFYRNAYNKNGDDIPDDSLLSGIRLLYTHENPSGFSSTLLKLTPSQVQEIYDLLNKYYPSARLGNVGDINRKKKLIKPKSKRKKICRCK